MAYVFLILFLLCVPLANWMIGNFGTKCIPDGPCLIPVWWGVMAPSGVLVIGLAFVLRDLVQRYLGRWWAVAAILVGAGLSLGVAPAHLAIASGVAFLFSELADFAVYTPLAQRRFFLAVVASSIVGVVVDSMLFLHLAFGSFDHLDGQIIGKLLMVAAAAPLAWMLRGNLKQATP